MFRRGQKICLENITILTGACKCRLVAREPSLVNSLRMAFVRSCSMQAAVYVAGKGKIYLITYIYDVSPFLWTHMFSEKKN